MPQEREDAETLSQTGRLVALLDHLGLGAAHFGGAMPGDLSGLAAAHPRRAGLRDLVCFPSLVALDRPGGPIWRNREDAVLSRLEPEEAPAWQKSRQAAAAENLLFMAHPLHCAVGRKPES